MNGLVRRAKLLLRNHPLFSPYYNYVQWQFRGRKYSRRKISPCYQQLYDDVAETVLESRPHTILEFGCGDAYLLRTIRAHGKGERLYGCDFSRTQLKSAAALFPEAAFDLQNITSTTYSDKAFDVAVGLGVMMYLNPSQLGSALQELRRISQRIVLVEMSCRYLGEEQARRFKAEQDGRFDYDYEKECRRAGFANVYARRCEQFWNPQINTLGEMGYVIVVADSL